MTIRLSFADKYQNKIYHLQQSKILFFKINFKNFGAKDALYT